MVDRVRYTSIFCYALVSEVDLAVFVQSNVLKQSVTFDCIVDIRFGFFVQVDNFCIASAFEVEYAVVIPAVLVITDQQTFRVCRKSCFTCSGQTEEDCCVFTVHVSVCGAVHGSHAFQRQEVVHHREHTFFHFSAVPCIYDNLFFACDVEHNSCFRVQTQLFVVLNFCFGSVVYNEIRLEVFQFFSSRFDEHVCYKVSLPSNLNDETDCHTGVFVGTAESIYYEQSLVRQFFDSQCFYSIPCFLSSRMVVVFIFICCPPYSVFGILIFYDKFVFRRTTCVDTSHNVDSTQFTFLAFFKAFQSRFCLFFEQHLIRWIVHDLSSSSDAILA